MVVSLTSVLTARLSLSFEMSITSLPDGDSFPTLRSASMFGELVIAACSSPRRSAVASNLWRNSAAFAGRSCGRFSSALRTTARIMFLLSFNWETSSWNRVRPLAAPRMAAADAFYCQPATPCGSIARQCSDRIGRAARLIAAARRKHLRGSLLPPARDPDQQPCDHRIVLKETAIIDEAWPKPAPARPSARRNRARSRRRGRSAHGRRPAYRPPAEAHAPTRAAAASCGCGRPHRRSSW